MRNAAAETTSSMPTGWSWLCPCGWSTTRNTSLEQTELRRHGHLRLHTAPITIQKQAGVA